MTDDTSQGEPLDCPIIQERHVRIERHRSAMLKQAAEFRFSAAYFEKILTEAPDNDEEINSRAVEMQHGAFLQLTKMIATYREMRDIQGEA